MAEDREIEEIRNLVRQRSEDLRNQINQQHQSLQSIYEAALNDP